MKFIIKLVTALFFLFFASCGFKPSPSVSWEEEIIYEETDKLTLEDVDLANAVTYSYSSADSPNIFEVTSTEACLRIENIPTESTIWLTRTNPSKYIISADKTTFIEAANGIKLNAYSNFSSSRSLASATDSFYGNQASDCLSIRLNANLPLELEISPTRATLDTSELKAAVTQIEPVVDKSTKNLYVDTNSSMQAFKEKPAVLRATGQYCYVWVVSEESNEEQYWTSSSTLAKNGQQINSDTAQKIASNFDKIYPMVRKVFGNESDQLIYQGNSIKSMNNYSDTGTKVNIVVYDIAADFGQNDNSNIVGYFYAKDYYYDYANGVAKYSNCGKYFYIDAYFAANKPALVYSTLAHEFQHMVDFGVKTMSTIESAKLLQSSSWYNEMKSMLCEDIMKNYLEEHNSDFTDADSPFYRLPLFCRHYYDIGLEYDKTDDKTLLYSYSNNYAFGAWAARNYGGISFINKLSTNYFIDIESIENAAGTSISEMLKNYTAACVVDKSGYGFNKSLTQTEFYCNGYDYPLDAVDLWNLGEILPLMYKQHRLAYLKDLSEAYSFVGPVYFAYNIRHALRPYGFMISKVGKSNGTEIALKFNMSKADSNQKTYIIIE